MSSHASLSRFLAILIVLLFFPFYNFCQSVCQCAEYNKYKNEYENSNTESKVYIKELLASSNIICQASGYEWLANGYSDAANYDTAEIYFQKAEKLYKQSGCNDSVLISTYKNWAQLHYTKSDFAKTQEYSFKLLRVAEASGNPFEVAVCYTMIAQIFNQTAQADKGIIYSRMAASLLEKVEDPAKKADLLFKLSKRYLWHYQDTKTIASLDSSEFFSYQQLAIAKKINRPASVAVAFGNLEGIAWERKDFKKALQLLDSSFKYTDSRNYDNLGTNYYDKADILIEMKEYPEAEKMADSSLRYRKLAGNPAYIAEVYDLLLSRIGKETGNFRKAYEYRELARAITDSIRNTETTTQVAELERKYNQAKNENTIKELAQQKQIYSLLAIAGLLAAMAVSFFLRQQSLKHKQTILETEQRLNRSRMNPHFFFNTLASLQSFVLREHDSKAIASNISKFSHIMRETLESTYKEYVTIEQEIEFLNEYLELQQVRFPQKFLYEIQADEEIETDTLMIPSMILQPFVENSIEHGFAGIDQPGHIHIQFSEGNKEMIIVIKDNGKGLTTIGKENNEHTSRASQIIKDRIYLLNIKLKTKARFSIANNNDESGVTVRIHLPLIRKHEVTADR